MENDEVFKCNLIEITALQYTFNIANHIKNENISLFRSSTF